ncbi:hypothetical protein CWE08_02040 [Aliidiomarina iranensis]|uniref:Glycosyltransferase 2-like domain-containing protein n=1 Tax=Aliidiomarina iranensis TaxID=1434071 RepID=A0A432W2L4_9GAMM|nr:glycosyltransferase family A protein [Aliidiomarina iranensis]RUO23450.1 hypothetical protein CWE08_02040 [Aliidiomarina iranensis]
MNAVTKQSATMDVFVFSFNRGQFLRNCIRSVQTHWPRVNITVVDDRSDDKETQAVLSELKAEGVQVLLAPEKSFTKRHGGLYNNMQLALEIATERSTEYALFLQDDMQVVRDIDEADTDYIPAFFNEYPQAAFLHPLFLKGARKRRDQAITYLSGKLPVYFRKKRENKTPRGISYSDCFIAHIPRLRQASWQFQGSEVSNARQAERLFGDMGFMLHPIAMYLPEVPVYRGKRKTRWVELAQERGGESPNAFLPLHGAALKRLKERNVKQQLPVAEHYLKTTRAAKKPFRYSQINAFPVLRVLHKIEQIIKKR